MKLQNEHISIFTSTLYLFILAGWLFITISLASASFAKSLTESVLFPLLFIVFYAGYGLFTTFFYLLGFPQGSGTMNATGWARGPYLPYLIKMAPEYREMRHSISLRGKYFLILFIISKALILIGLISLAGLAIHNSYTNTSSPSTLFAIACLIAMLATNTIWTWLFTRLFGLTIVTKAYNRPIFDVKEETK